MKVGDMVQVRADAVLGAPGEWGLLSREAMVAKTRAHNGVGIIICEEALRMGYLGFKVLWGGHGQMVVQPANTIEVINENR